MTLLRRFALIAALVGFAPAVVLAQPQLGSAQASYISVMSKAGASTPRPSVPNRSVSLPSGAGAGYNYYYGYRYGYGGGSPSPSYANETGPSTSSTLPGYDTRPRRSQSSKRDGFGYRSSRR
jgi:hypothetical protein